MTPHPPNQSIDDIQVSWHPGCCDRFKRVHFVAVKTTGVDNSAPCPSADIRSPDPNSPPGQLDTYIQKEGGKWTDGSDNPIATPDFVRGYKRNYGKVVQFQNSPGGIKKIVLKRPFKTGDSLVEEEEVATIVGDSSSRGEVGCSSGETAGRQSFDRSEQSHESAQEE